MRGHFGKGPALLRRLPVQLLVDRSPHKILDTDRRLLEHGSAGQRASLWHAAQLLPSPLYIASRRLFRNGRGPLTAAIHGTIVDTMAEALAFVDDIFFQAKIRETAKLVGVDVCFCTTPDALFAEMDREKPNLVVIDLNA